MKIKKVRHGHCAYTPALLSLLLALFFLPWQPLPLIALPAPEQTAAQHTLVQQANAILNNLNNLTGSFVQTNSYGAREMGKFWLRKPGRIKFEYDNTSQPFSVTSDNVWVVIKKGDNIPQRYPLRFTPLRLLLQKNIDLAAHTDIIKVEEYYDHFTLTVRSKNIHVIGTLTMSFSLKNKTLLGWSIRDIQNQVTNISLLDAHKKVMPYIFFEVQDHPTPAVQPSQRKRS